MNRHILGLTLFLIIVKTSFFVYWGFFAPNSFFSMQTGCHLQTKVQTQTVPTENAPSKKISCFPALHTDETTSAIAPAELTNLTIDFKDARIWATIKTDLKSDKDFLSRTWRIYIFDEKKNFVWTSSTRPGGVRDDGLFVMFSEPLSNPSLFERKKNYYARVKISASPNDEVDESFFDLHKARPVLFNYGKK
jgi:hypothetical protein